MRSMQCNVDFRCQLNICSWTEKNHGKPGPLKIKFCIKFNSHFTENILCVHYKRQSINCWEVIGIYCEHYTKYMNTHCRKNEGIYIVTVSGLTDGCKLWLWLQAPMDSVRGQRLSDLCLTDDTKADIFPGECDICLSVTASRLSVTVNEISRRPTQSALLQLGLWT